MTCSPNVVKNDHLIKNGSAKVVGVMMQLNDVLAIKELRLIFGLFDTALLLDVIRKQFLPRSLLFLVAN